MSNDGGSTNATVDMVLFWGLLPILLPIYLVHFSGEKLFEATRNGVVRVKNRVNERRYATRQDELLAQNSRLYTGRLVPGSRQIRLLVLPPSHEKGLKCELVLADWATARYEALSYAWGSSVLCRQIEINGQRFAVRDNLHAALLNLRRPHARALWIDAVCINQSDVAERADQVAQMQDIFRQANRVVVWLGAAPKNMQNPSNAQLEVGVVTELLRRPWWRRTWVIQELLLADSVVVQCGPHHFPWESLLEGVEQLPKDSREAWNARSMANTRRQWRSGATFSQGLLKLAYQFRHREASDPRDKLYALFGLVRQLEVVFRPDYTPTPEHVFRNFALAWVDYHGSLMAVRVSQWQPARPHSWYPVWNEPFVEDTELLCGTWTTTKEKRELLIGRFNAAGGLQVARCAYPANNGVLRLAGFRHDMIAAVSALCKTGEAVDEPWHLCIAEWSRFAAHHTGRRAEVLRSELCLAATAGHSNSEAALVEGAGHEVVRNVVCGGRRLFVTRGGRLGLGPAQTTAGDHVCVLIGSPVPLVLSECKTCVLSKGGDLLPHPGSDTTGEDIQTWRLVGDAYLHDIMKYEGSLRVDIEDGKVTLEDFHFCT
jgi:hypothetical protein